MLSSIFHQQKTAVFIGVRYEILKIKNATFVNAASAELNVSRTYLILRRTEVEEKAHHWCKFTLCSETQRTFVGHQKLCARGRLRTDFKNMQSIAVRNSENSIPEELVTNLEGEPATRNKCSQLQFLCVVTGYCTCPPDPGCLPRVDCNRPPKLQRSGVGGADAINDEHQMQHVCKPRGD